MDWWPDREGRGRASSQAGHDACKTEFSEARVNVAALTRFIIAAPRTFLCKPPGPSSAA